MNRVIQRVEVEDLVCGKEGDRIRLLFWAYRIEIPTGIHVDLSDKQLDI